VHCTQGQQQWPGREHTAALTSLHVVSCWPVEDSMRSPPVPSEHHCKLVNMLPQQHGGLYPGSS
jgi:hypothetical protein